MQFWESPGRWCWCLVWVSMLWTLLWCVCELGSEPQLQKFESSWHPAGGTDPPAMEVTERSQRQNSRTSCAFTKYLCHFLPHPERKRIRNILSSKQTSSGATGCVLPKSTFGKWYLIQHQMQQWFCSGCGRKRNPKQRTSRSLAHLFSSKPHSLLFSLPPRLPLPSYQVAGVLKTDGCFAEGIMSLFKFLCSRTVPAQCMRHKVWKN